MTVFEIVGYAASVIVAVSLMMSSILKLRVLNMIGGAVFSTYGLLIHAYPVALLNFFIVCIDAYYLIRMLGTKEYFSIIRGERNSQYVTSFLSFYDKDIRHICPEFDFTMSERAEIFFVLRDMIPAGILIVERGGEYPAFIRLDYVIPRYRDFKVADFLFRKKGGYFRDSGIRELYTYATHDMHRGYLLKIGFSVHGESDKGIVYRKVLD